MASTIMVKVCTFVSAAPLTLGVVSVVLLPSVEGGLVVAGLEHAPRLQACVGKPVQLAPEPEGAGFVQLRDCIPGPQEAEHRLHADQPPSTSTACADKKRTTALSAAFIMLILGSLPIANNSYCLQSLSSRSETHLKMRSSYTSTELNWRS
jgi:hypothetical protein